MEVSEGEAVIERAENCFTVGYSTTIDCSRVTVQLLTAIIESTDIVWTKLVYLTYIHSIRFVSYA